MKENLGDACHLLAGCLLTRAATVRVHEVKDLLEVSVEVSIGTRRHYNNRLQAKSVRSFLQSESTLTPASCGKRARGHY